MADAMEHQWIGRWRDSHRTKATVMGNWMTVHVAGTCAPEDVRKLSAALDPGSDWSNFGPLSNAFGLCGINDWSGTTIDKTGNLAERDYSVEDVAEHLRKLVDAAPSLIVRIDCGGDHESDEVIATVIVGEDRTVTVLPPQTDKLGPIPPEQMKKALDDVIGGNTRW